jgi:hypothetical protein
VKRLRSTTIWKHGVATVILGPLVDEGGRPDPDDWDRYHRELVEAERSTRHEPEA